MASSVESRVPFLTPDLVNFLGRLPEAYLISPDGTSKSVFRKAMRGIVPDAVLDRRDKIGFATPELLWLSELDPWVRDVLNCEEARQLPFLNLPEMHKEWDAMKSRKKQWDCRIWRWLSLILWVKQFQVTF
jgi:asparagine synthase (glutamine-hydrolysing)